MATTQRKLLHEEEIPQFTAGAWEVKKGQYVRIIGRHTVDFVVFNLNNLQERFDQARTKTNQLKIFLSTGDTLYSKDNNPMLTIVEDTWKWHHDLQKGTCSRKKFEINFKTPEIVKHDVWGAEGVETQMAQLGRPAAPRMLGEPDRSSRAMGHQQVGYAQSLQHLSKHEDRRRNRANVVRPPAPG